MGLRGTFDLVASIDDHLVSVTYVKLSPDGSKISRHKCWSVSSVPDAIVMATSCEIQNLSPMMLMMES